MCIYVLKLLKLSKQSMNFTFRKRELLQKLGVSSSTLDRWVKDGRFPAPTKIGRILLWNQETVSKWLQTQHESQQ